MSKSTTHIALFPSAGMGHLTPFLRLAAALLSRGCAVTLIAAQPPVSATESSHLTSFLSQHPEVNRVDFYTSPPQCPTNTTDDPFFLQFAAISRSAHTLLPSLSLSSPLISALFADIAVIASAAPIASELGIPSYIVATSSAKFLCLAAYLPDLLASNNYSLDLTCNEKVEIPSVGSIPTSSLPPPFKDPNHLFTSIFVENSRAFWRASGIIVNSFDWFEKETLEALNSGRVLSSLPRVFPIGPLEMCEKKERREKEKEEYLLWLDQQPMKSVVYVSFGSRTAMSRDQIRELSKGLEISGHRFLWVVKTSKVDKEDTEEIEDLLGEAFLERTKGIGLVQRVWVSQVEILGHPSIGAFVNHCGWNSVTEAASFGVPVVAWPLHGDQRLNAEVVESAGLGIWERSWGWVGQKLVSGDEIGKKIREAMEDEKSREMARKVGDEAKKAVGIGGSSETVLMELLEFLQYKGE